MKWSLEGLEQRVERLVSQCEDKVIQELEQDIMTRLRAKGEAVIQCLFQEQSYLVVSTTEHPEVSVEKEDTAPQALISEVNNTCQLSKVCDFSRADPTPFTDEEVLYAFGIIKTNQYIVDLPGMEDRPCRIVENGNLGMLVCPVPKKEYNEESLHLHMEDMAWVENHARRHEETLMKTIEGRSIIPLPFCTIFTDEENIRRQLAQNAEDIQEDLRRLENQHEIHVKLFVNRIQLLEKLHEDQPYIGVQSGGGYFQKRQWEKKIEEEMERVMNDYGESLYQDLNNIATEVILLDKSGVVVSEGQHVVFAVQCLMPKEYREEWNKKLGEFDELVDPLGFNLEVSGPWPPYHFSRLTNEEETAGG
ncbi:GvpL/GvpF family gas vesicle protein [Desulfosporosinus fructosivorans]|uniref:GvpL/GvpF family gas vesicle protein n=1 Tax=Desulfosporosinus fructosivorans TaxID=2018669 RepID=A0A4Z0QVM3_9FIRM|nr:GvpL/GvpF family gas vesicle protein [Desulfosporosinus fructosivorans]TGE34891.1 GvpL/GvpF family gas vesicle protein [Desulfosporosinus fructosivorans]